ncbi:universal stress protein [Mesonia oceanica]|uniref:Universal stress protein C n=1 Tax=Mesonia oceanica TaxID=2687242 RepID=A0AC61YCG7_9FLAO|nr:universal stress protein [Mesonia oceanica]MAQ39718.1 universal stress protein [Mesonia sp.]VVV02202.1 Universal stress protein C [Mesonia oceanica]|tara:strand:- start:13553 stop:14014 length:462 start_codon:yes stop_codon:yes gene_type:complete
MKKICIAIDTSPSAEKVAKLGYEYAQALNAEVVLLHVIYDVEMYQYDYDPIMGYEGFFIQQDIKLVDNLKAETEIFLKATAEYLGNPSIETKVLEGINADSEILDFVNTWGADLLVIGTHSHSFMENVLMGNIATKIVRHSKTPLLVVPIKQD